MRIDLLLNKLCLTKTRTIAKHACDKNLVWINQKLAKASHEAKAGDVVRLDLYGFSHEIQILTIPLGNVAKKDASQHYSMLSKTSIE